MTHLVVKHDLKARDDLEKGLKYFKQNAALVGVTSESNSVREGGIDQAALLHIHQAGAPRAGIPATGVLTKGAQGCVGEASGLLAAAVSEAISGNIPGAADMLDRVGASGEASVKAQMGSLVDTGALRAAISHKIGFRKGG